MYTRPFWSRRDGVCLSVNSTRSRRMAHVQEFSVTAPPLGKTRCLCHHPPLGQSMKLLYRYLAGQLFPPLVVGAVMLSLVFILSGLFDVIDLLFSVGMGAGSAVKLFLCFLPYVLIITTPIAFLLSCLLTYGRLSEEHEVGAMRAGGFRFFDLLVPAVVLSVAVSAVLLWWTTQVSPAAWRVQEKILLDVVNRTSFIRIFPEGKFNTKLGGDLGGGIVFRAKKVEEEEQMLRGVVIYKMDAKRKQQIDSIIVAPEADVAYDAASSEVLLSLRNAVWHQGGDAFRSLSDEMDASQEIASATASSATYTIAGFGAFQVRIPIGDWILNMLPVRRVGRMNNDDIRREIEAVRRGEIVPDPEKETPEERIRDLRSEIAERFAMALCPIAFALAGVPVGLSMRTGRKSAAFVTCLVILSLYYALFFGVGKSLVEASSLPPSLFLQMPNVLLSIGGVIACWRMSKS